MAKITVSLAQMPIKLGDIQANLQRVEHIAEESARRGSSLVVLPELWSTGYALEQAESLASPLNEGLFSNISAIASQHQINIIGSVLENREEGVTNSATVYNADGALLAVYRKIHLFRLMNEHHYLKSGQAPLVVDMPWGKTGVAICYDLRFPELFRRYALEGAKVVILPAEWPLVRVDHWRTLLQARAIENQYYIVAVNTTGLIGDTVFAGHSMIIDPWGKIVVEAGETDALLTAEIDLDAVDEIRQKIPVFEDRRPNLYSPQKQES